MGGLNTPYWDYRRFQGQEGGRWGDLGGMDGPDSTEKYVQYGVDTYNTSQSEHSTALDIYRMEEMIEKKEKIRWRKSEKNKGNQGKSKVNRRINQRKISTVQSPD